MKHGGPRKFTQTSDYLLVCYLSMVAVVKAAHNTQMLFPGSLELISFALHRFLDFLLLTHRFREYELRGSCWILLLLVQVACYHPLNNGNNDFKVMSSFEPL